jgi:hypothetical protein
MTERFLLPKARNTLTGQTVKTQDLTGVRYGLSQRSLAENAAAQLALKMTQRTNQTWVGFVETYTPSQRKA